MGCDIHTFVEIRRNGAWELAEIRAVWDWRSYEMFAVLAGVRNYSAIPPLSMPRGWPDDVSSLLISETAEWDTHSHSFYLLSELLEFNWDQAIENRRVAHTTMWGYIDEGATCEPGQGRITTYRKMLSPQFFEELEMLKNKVRDPKELRILFCFDN